MDPTNFLDVDMAMLCTSIISNLQGDSLRRQ